MGKFPYFPHTEEDVKQMLDRVGLPSLEGLYSDVPERVIYSKEYDLPEAMSEQEVRDFFESLASKNSRLKVLVGQGAYDITFRLSFRISLPEVSSLRHILLTSVKYPRVR